MAERDRMALTDALARLGPRAASRVLRTVWETTHALTGRRLQGRSRFLDYAMFGGEFEASAAAVRRRAPDGFEIVEHAPGRTVVSVLALDYRAVDVVPPYRELAVTVPVRYRGEEGALVLEMPVTNEVARFFGVELYGFPKMIADIELSEDGGSHVCRVTAAGTHVLTLRTDQALVSRGVPIRDRLITVRGDDRVIGSRFEGEGEIGRSDERGGAKLELGEHSIAHGLRALEIATSSLRHVDAPRASAILSKGEELGTLMRPVPAAPKPESWSWTGAPVEST